MPYKPKKTVFAVHCHVTFQPKGRMVLLAFDTDDGPTLISLPEHLMAEITGHFLRERLFVLH